MKILLADIVHENQRTERLFSHLGLAYLAAASEKVMDDLNFRIVQGNPLRVIDEFTPDIIGLSSVTQNFNLAKKYAREIKNKLDVPIIIGGVHISCLPDNLTKFMDVGVIGEGEETFVELLKIFKSGFNRQKLADVAGIAYHANGKIVKTQPRLLIKPLDKIPRPKRSLLSIARKSRVHIFSSRGCPYRCSFCSSSRFWRKIRYFSPAYVLNEIEELIDNYQPSQIVFYDDLFIAPKTRFKEIAQLIKRKGIDKKVEFVISGRANLITEENAKLLKDINVCSVNLGLESGSPRTLKKLKAAVTVEDNHNAVRLLNKAGIQVNASFIIGAASETKEDIFETYKFIKNHKLNIVLVYPLTPLPGTPVWDQALKLGLVCNDMDWDKLGIEFQQNSETGIIVTDKISRSELVEIFKDFAVLAKRKRLQSLAAGMFRHPRRVVPYIKRNIF